MRLNHHRAEQLLSSYLDGELLPKESGAVQEHLLECGACREAYERLRATKALLGELPVAEPPAEFWAAVRGPEVNRRSSAAPLSQAHLAWLSPARLAGLLSAGVAGLSPARRSTLRRRVAWAAVAAVVLLALALTPMIKGTVDRLHAAEIGVDLYVREHALQMSTQPLTDRAYLGVVAGDADLVLVGEPARPGKATP
jgi:anti-sigma factor RsiW